MTDSKAIEKIAALVQPYCTDCDQYTEITGVWLDKRCADCGSGRWYWRSHSSPSNTIAKRDSND